MEHPIPLLDFPGSHFGWSRQLATSLAIHATKAEMSDLDWSATTPFRALLFALLKSGVSRILPPKSVLCTASHQ